MVPAAVLRHPPRHSKQAARRHYDVRLDRDALPAPLARHIARALRQLPAALPAVLLDLHRRRDRSWLSRLAAAGGWLRNRRPAADRLVLHSLSDRAAAP